MDIDRASSGWKRPPVVVIGAGASGLSAIKSCLEENLNVICFEKTDNTGGLWRFREDVQDGVASVMRSTVINTCKEINSYSDFPPPDDFPNYMHNTEIAKYFDLYSDKFNLKPHIYHRHVVEKVIQNEDFSQSGQWTVEVTNLQSGKKSRIIASAVMICSGHHSYPHIPTFKGLQDFKGTVKHTHSYKDYKPFENERVLVIGIGNSGADVAVELSRVCPKIYLSTRSGTWLCYRVGHKGWPNDYLVLSRVLGGPYPLLPRSLFNLILEKAVNQHVDLKMYNLKPKHRFLSQHPLINDALPNCILSGKVVIKGDIEHFSSDSVVFKAETDAAYPIDAVILATGYDIRFPFIDSNIIPVHNNFVHLYKYVFPPKIQPPTLAVIGLIQPIGSIVPISELQSRWFVTVLTRKSQLPSIKKMEDDIQRLRDEMSRTYTASKRHTIQVDFISYMDDIARHFGALPITMKLLQTDPKLWYYCYFRTNLPYVYRLSGPHAWAGARNAILTADNRVRAALQTNKIYKLANQNKPSGFFSYFKFATAIFTAVIAAKHFGSKRIHRHLKSD